MGLRHLNDMRLNKGFVPTAVCDSDPARLEVAAREFPGIQTYSDVATMLRKSDVELLAVVLPHDLHAKVAIKCLNAGRHVVVEKPFAITVKECDEMIAAAKKSKVVLSAYHNRHWDSNILTIKKHLSKIGRPFRWDSFGGGFNRPGDWWRSKKDVSGGIIYDWGAHFCEWMLQVMDYDMQEINGYMVKEVWKHVTNEDELEAVVRFKGNAVASHTATDIALVGKDMIRITGTKGAIVCGHGHCDVFVKDEDNQTVKTSVKMVPARNSDYYKNVHDHLFNSKKLIITPEWARRVIQVLDYANRSARKGTGLKAKYK